MADAVDDSNSVISAYIRRFREQGPTPLEQRRANMANARSDFWWKEEEEEPPVHVQKSSNSLFSDLSVSRIVDNDISLKTSQSFTVLTEQTHVNLDDYTSELLNKCEELLEQYRTTGFSLKPVGRRKDSSFSDSSSSSSGSSSPSTSPSSHSSGSFSTPISPKETLMDPKVSPHPGHEQSFSDNIRTTVKDARPSIAMSPVDRGSKETRGSQPVDLSVSEDDSLYLSPYSSHVSSVRPSVDLSTFQPMHQPLTVDQQRAFIVKITDNQISTIHDNRSTNDKHDETELFGSHKDNTDAPSPSESFDSLRGIGIDIPAPFMDPGITRTVLDVDFDLVAPYLEDKVVSYLWTRLLTVRQQIQDFNNTGP